ncbi:MAG: 5'/3'-nucleotidase SurE [Candidatus Aureabacteria bacterium]|nr:5'/3'-nucleotidase SurE [Candidatus Auribacterota bacterium]
MKILLTNDDGINAPGLYALYREMRKVGEVSVIAPATERSAVGHAITTVDPLRVAEVKRDGELYGLAVSGTPADCVKIAINSLLPEKPDVVVSGINQGPNTGMNVIYSGTVSAATEATMLGVHAIAVSLDSFTSTEFAYAAAFAASLAQIVARKGLPEGVLLNVNVPVIPKDRIRGVMVTRQGMAKFSEEFHKRVDPRGRAYWWLGGELMEMNEQAGTDSAALREGMVSVTPIHYDMTAYESLDLIKGWKLTADGEQA